MAGAMNGIDPYKVWHTAVAISGAEELLGELRAPRGDRAGPSRP
jgi:hypothetical protein